MGAKMNNFQCFFLRSSSFTFYTDSSSTSTQHFPVLNSWILILSFLKVHVAEQGISDLFQYTQKVSGSFRAVIWTELQPKTETWLWKGKLLRVLLSQLAGQPACATAGLLFQIFPLRGINLSFFIPVHPLIFTCGFNTFEITACSTFDWNQLLGYWQTWTERWRHRQRACLNISSWIKPRGVSSRKSCWYQHAKTVSYQNI